jgi:hypothetical protein
MGGRKWAFDGRVESVRSAIVDGAGARAGEIRFQRAMLASLGSRTGWPNLLKEPFGRSGKVKLVKSAMLRRLLVAGQVGRPGDWAPQVPRVPYNPSSTDVHSHRRPVTQPVVMASGGRSSGSPQGGRGRPRWG